LLVDDRDGSTTPARRPLLVTHQMFGRALERTLLGLQPNDVLELSILHGTIVRLDRAAGNRAVLSDSSH
jgi:broad specificity phosphatase PhoE